MQKYHINVKTRIYSLWNNIIGNFLLISDDSPYNLYFLKIWNFLKAIFLSIGRVQLQNKMPKFVSKYCKIVTHCFLKSFYSGLLYKKTLP